MRPSGLSRMLPATLFLSFCAFAVSATQQQPEADAEAAFRIGVFADVQYADKESAGKRNYRNSLTLLESCLARLKAEKPDYLMQLGDLIDGRGGEAESKQDLDRVLAPIEKTELATLHVVGNHCLEVPRAALLPALKLKSAYYSLRRDGYRLVVLDALAWSTCGWPKESSSWKQGNQWLQQNQGKAKNVQSWNGGLGESQRAWLQGELDEALRLQEKVVIACHLPVCVEASSEWHLLWDHREVLKLVQKYPCVVLWLNGHDHDGGYAFQNGIHFLTLPGMVEADAQSNPFGILEFYSDRIELEGYGSVKSRTLRHRTPISAGS
ncbi:MAG: hypothetical protein DWQ01_21685 [Planctomycetota bacterium]|nr:MAG: hypothetical protein DWQ01_21685 [Planctomycetota bacterium]